MYLSMTQILVMDQIYYFCLTIFLPPIRSLSFNHPQSIVAKLVALHLPWISIQDQVSVEYPQV